MATRKISHPLEGHKQASAPKAPQHKAAVRRRRHTAGNAISGGIESEQRHTMISEAAYFLSKRRGFCPGRELDDWLSAEKDIDRGLLAGEQVSACGDGLGSAPP